MRIIECWCHINRMSSRQSLAFYNECLTTCDRQLAHAPLAVEFLLLSNDRSLVKLRRLANSSGATPSGSKCMTSFLTSRTSFKCFTNTLRSILSRVHPIAPDFQEVGCVHRTSDRIDL
jgi:hypothetical protein